MSNKNQTINKENKLRIGDRVKVIKNGHTKGWKGIIQAIDEGMNNPIYVMFRNHHRYLLDFKESELQLIPNTKSKWKYSRKEIVKLLIANPILSSTKAFIEMRNILMAKQDQLSPEEESQRIMMEQVPKEEILVFNNLMYKLIKQDKPVEKNCSNCFYYDSECPKCLTGRTGWKPKSPPTQNTKQVCKHSNNMSCPECSPPTQTTKHLDKPCEHEFMGNCIRECIKCGKTEGLDLEIPKLYHFNKEHLDTLVVPEKIKVFPGEKHHTHIIKLLAKFNELIDFNKQLLISLKERK